MKKISLLFFLCSLILFGFISENYEKVYALNIKGEEQLVNNCNKTVVILTSSIECSGCESFLNSYMEKREDQDSFKLVLIAKYNSSIILRRQLNDNLIQKFTSLDNVLFFTIKHKICNKGYLDFENKDFPIVILINNEKEYSRLFTFNEIATEKTFGLSKNKEFNKAFNRFISD